MTQILTATILSDKNMITVYSENNSPQVTNEAAYQVQTQSIMPDKLSYVDIDQRIQSGLIVLESVDWSKK